MPSSRVVQVILAPLPASLCSSIRVNSITPCYMDTILNEGEGLKGLRRAWAKRNPHGRMGQPEEVTGAIVLLPSQAGSYIPGADILVDGGLSAF
ncbi:hypothetical protein BJX76DRAFT_334815 [Aspergillus varians]